MAKSRMLAIVIVGQHLKGVAFRYHLVPVWVRLAVQPSARHSSHR
jgi:hypothetical protein